MQKVACITGASEGLGREFTLQLAQRGYRTISIARNEERLKELVNELGEGHSYLRADLGNHTDLAACEALFGEEHIHLLINNAGFSRFGNYREADLAHEQNVLNVNCLATMRLSHAFLQQAAAGDALINLSSITHYQITPIQPTYCATKSFIASFSQSLWYQERKRGVYVQGLLPGVTRTRFIERSAELTDKKMQWINALSSTPERVVGISLKAMDKRKKPLVIPGFGNKFTAVLFSLLPCKWVTGLMGKIGDLA